MAVTLDAKPLTGFESAKVRALLAYLAAESGRPHARERLAELLWPEQPAGMALGNLRHVLANLRRVLGEHSATPSFLIVSPDTLAFNPAADAFIDLGHFNALTADGVLSNVEACREAVGLYHGSFLQDFTLDGSPDFEEWLAVVREQVDRRLVQALAVLAGHSAGQGDYLHAAQWTRRQVAVEPWNEEAHRQLMALLALGGQRAAALHQAAVCARLLTEELGVEPQPETLALIERIRTGQATRADPAELLGKGLVLRTPLQNLPAPSTPFFGRSAELAYIAQCLADPTCRLLTILGPGGVGKTRLAIQAASEQAAQFAHGVGFVSLTAVQGDLWVSSVLQALQVPAQGAVEPWQQLLAFLRDKTLLLVLDNFEHLVGQAGRIADLLAAAPQCKLLVTSRVRLNLSSEWLIPLDGLEAPPGVAVSPALEASLASAPVQDWRSLEGYSAVQLFLHGIRRLQPNFVPAPADAPVAARICRVLSGIPLAIELASAWVRFLGLAGVLDQLEQSLDLLATTLCDVPDRHRSMRAVFDHSWQMLSAREQRLMRQMAVFQGGCSADAAAAVTGAGPADLSRLVDRSWLRVLPSGRYEMHELVRQYAEARLLEAQGAPGGEAAMDVRRRHCAYYAGLQRVRGGMINLHQTAMSDIMSDYGNFLAAWQRAVEDGNMAAALDMVMVFYFTGDMLGAYRFTLHLFESALHTLMPYLHWDDPDPQPRQTIGAVLGWLHYARTWHLLTLGLLDEVHAENERNLAIQSRLAPDDAQKMQLLMIAWAEAWLVYYRGDFAGARRRFRIMLRRFGAARVDYLWYGQEIGAKFWQVHAEACLARMAWVAGRYRPAQQRMRKALLLRQQIGEQRYRAFNLGFFARILLSTGEYAQAKEAAYAGLRLSESCGDQVGVAFGHLAVGQVESAIGNSAPAQIHFLHSEAAGRQTEYHQLLMESLIGLGRLELALGHPGEAKRRFEDAMQAFVTLGVAYSNALAGVALGLGWAALAAEDLAQAEHHFRQVLTLHRAAWETLDAFAGLGQNYLCMGRLAEAAALLAYVLHHPATLYTTRRHVAKTLPSELEQPASPDAVAAVLGRSFRLVG